MITIIGTTGEGKSTSSGQEIRTKILVESMKSHFDKNNISLVDTGLISHNKIKFLWKLIISILTSKDIILIVSRNGLRILLPILAASKTLFNKRIYNNVIGGNILELVGENPKYVDYMKKFAVNWVQMDALAEGLKRLGVENVEVLPNSKPLNICENTKKWANKEIFHFCTFSRISEAKGIKRAIDTIEKINRLNGRTVATLDIYGVPDEDYKEEFEEIIKNTSEAIDYRGVVKYDKSTEILSNYFVLLFPTTFYGEGFPGTVLDAYAAGLPVIATDWKFNAELIKNNVNGLIYSYKKPEKLFDLVKYAIDNPQIIDNMRKECLKEAEKYTPEKVMSIVFNKVEKNIGGE